jgi:5-methylcytosine-specific restriction endonuclease McrA
MDHVIPLSKGGSHTKSNTQLACFGCNTLKGDRVDSLF